MRLNELAIQHHLWVERMGWHNVTVLEALGLIASEVGETADETLGAVLPPDFAEELADTTLRTLDLAVDHGMDVEAAVGTEKVVWRTATLHGHLAEVMIDLSRCVNAARKEIPGDDFTHSVSRLLARLHSLALLTGVDLHAELVRKMAINETRGTRGRRQ